MKIAITFEVDDDDRLSLAEAYPGGQVTRDTVPLTHAQMRSFIVRTIYGELDYYRMDARGKVPDSVAARYNI